MLGAVAGFGNEYLLVFVVASGTSMEEKRRSVVNGVGGGVAGEAKEVGDSEQQIEEEERDFLVPASQQLKSPGLKGMKTVGFGCRPMQHDLISCSMGNSVLSVKWSAYEILGQHIFH